MPGPVFHSYVLSSDQPIGNGGAVEVRLVANPDDCVDPADVEVHIKGQHPVRVEIFKADLDGDGEIDFGARTKDRRVTVTTLQPGVFRVAYTPTV